MTAGTAKPSVFDAELPTLSYDITETPADVYPRIRDAQRVSPLAIGPLRPEVLGYELARSVLRDPRFVIPPGIHLTAPGVTPGPLWDRVIDSMLLELCAPAAAYLSHESCTLNGEALQVGMGSVARMAIVISQGISVARLTAEDNAANLSTIMDATEARVTTSTSRL